MAKISEIPLLAKPIGNEHAVVADPADSNRTKRVPVGDLANAAVAPAVAQALAARDEAVAARKALQIVEGALLDPLEYERSGYAEFLVDRDFNLVSGTKANGLGLGPYSVGGQIVEPLAALEYERSGFSGFTVDADFNLIQGTGDAGHSAVDLSILEYERSGYSRFTVDFDFNLIEGQKHAVALPAPIAIDSYVVVEQMDGAGNLHVYSEQRATGRRVQLSTAGTKNELRRVTGDGYALYASDRLPRPAGGLFAAPVNGGAEVSVLPYLALVGFGDSQQGMGSTDNTGSVHVAAQQLGFPTARQFGVGGQSASQAASRLVSVPMTLATGTIPASGSVAVTVLGADPITGGMPNMRIRYLIAGVSMILTRDTNGSGAYTLTRQVAGAAVPVAPGIIAYAMGASIIGGGDPVDYPRDCIAIIQLGRNDFDTIESNVAAIRTVIGSLTPLTRRFIIPLVLPAGTGLDGSVIDPIEPTGSERRGRVEAMNTALRAAFGDACLDLLPIMQAHGNGSAEDNSDIASGYVPRSLRTDFLHANEAGRAVQGRYGYAPLIQQKGWTQQ